MQPAGATTQYSLFYQHNVHHNEGQGALEYVSFHYLSFSFLSTRAHIGVIAEAVEVESYAPIENCIRSISGASRPCISSELLVVYYPRFG